MRSVCKKLIIAATVACVLVFLLSFRNPGNMKLKTGTPVELKKCFG